MNNRYNNIEMLKRNMARLTDAKTFKDVMQDFNTQLQQMAFMIEEDSNPYPDESLYRVSSRYQ